MERRKNTHKKTLCGYRASVYQFKGIITYELRKAKAKR